MNQRKSAINLEQFSKDSKRLSLIGERLDIVIHVLALPYIIPEKGPCKQLAAFLVTEAGSSISRGWLQLSCKYIVLLELILDSRRH
jgi:hypothetical protein